MDTRGRVIKKKVGEGSKSERNAVLVRTDAGEYILRRVGGHPFHDDVLEDLVGKDVRFRGTLHGNTLVFKDYAVADD
jgi:hypothetical protein